jgi:hypothetical protein
LSLLALTGRDQPLARAQFGVYRLAQGPVFIDLAIGAFAVLTQKHGSMFRTLDFPTKGVISTTRTSTEFHSERKFGFGDRSL